MGCLLIEKSLRKMDVLIKACGKDPALAMSAEMKNVVTKLTCMECSSRRRATKPMSFDDAVSTR